MAGSLGWITPQDGWLRVCVCVHVRVVCVWLLRMDGSSGWVASQDGWLRVCVRMCVVCVCVLSVCGS